MPTGLTKDAGYQVGAQKTIEVAPDRVWDFLISKEGLKLWLGSVPADQLEQNVSFKTAEGATGRITTFHPGSHLRMKWQPKDWDNETSLQLRVIPNQGKTTIAFHQDQMLDANQRTDMKEHWKEVLVQIEKRLRI